MVATDEWFDRFKRSVSANGQRGAVVSTITPAMSEYFLRNNACNRPLSMRHVMKMARHMENGTMHYQGDSIGFNRGWYLVDGQHRCNASIISQCSFDAIIATGLPDQNPYKDTGHRARTTAHLLEMMRYVKKHQKEIGAAAKYIKYLTENPSETTLMRVSSNINQEDILGQFDKFSNTLKVGAETILGNTGLKGVCRPWGLWIAVYAILASNPDNRHKVAEFFSVMEHGISAQDCPVKALRDYTLRGINMKNGKKADEALGKIQAAWRAHVENRGIKVLRSRRVEPFLP